MCVCVCVCVCVRAGGGGVLEGGENELQKLRLEVCDSQG